MPANANSPDSAEFARARLGTRARTLRKQAGLTLKELSQRSGVALSTLSKMELGQTTVGYEKLAAVAKALKLDIGKFFSSDDAVASGGPGQGQSDAIAAASFNSDTYEFQMLATDFANKHMTPVGTVVYARERSQFKDFIRHEGQEFVVVLVGSVRIEFETGQTINLKRHQSAYFDSGVGHVYLSTSKLPARLVVVMAD